MISALVLSLLVLLNISCSSTPKISKVKFPVKDKLSDILDSTPPVEPQSKYGNPPFYEVNGRRYYTRRSSRGYKERGIASWYGSEFQGRRTSSGETYNMYAMTAAHRSLPLPCYVMVTNLSNGRQIIVRVNDRGPFYSDRIIDLSYAAAVKLGLARPGTGLVEVRAIELEPGNIAAQKGIASKEDFYIQVGAFQNRSYAEQLQKQLQSMIDAAVKVNSVPRQQASFYQVRIGPLSSTEKLDSLAERLTDMGFPNHIIVH
jgi:rare lipoprotein A